MFLYIVKKKDNNNIILSKYIFYIINIDIVNIKYMIYLLLLY